MDFHKNIVKSLCESENLTDIAPLGKATQSSLSKWSKPNDAQRAVIDIGDATFAFHTDKEQNPWWELTLDKPRFIEYIILHNRKDMCKEKARKLSVELFDGKEYIKIYEGDLLFDAEPNGLPLILPYKYPLKIERIKITSQINEYFHLLKVNVLSIKREEKPLYNKKIVFCKPRSGLNDMLVQMQKCRRYALTYDRELYIDGSKGGFLDSFSNYFTAPEGVYFDGFDFMQYEFTCYPACLENDVINYKVIYSNEKRKFVYAATSKLITFDFTKPYEEDILIHEQSGGGLGVDAFEWLRLNEKVKLHIVSTLNKLREYDAIHVRNTDYKTDYKTFFENIKNKLGDKIVLCTDDLQCQLHAKSFFGDRLYIVTELPDTRGKPLHSNRSLDRYGTNLNTLTDLFILASGKNLYFSTILPCKEHPWTLKGIKISGFSILAKALHERQDLLKKILYGE
ncbi:MAG: discoidin domain-containing protein [Campylobacteraceae bacterium]|nr:discoidin domain-containing protein [Campylobacteraceae bacterium]